MDGRDSVQSPSYECSRSFRFILQAVIQARRTIVDARAECAEETQIDRKYIETDSPRPAQHVGNHPADHRTVTEPPSSTGWMQPFER